MLSVLREGKEGLILALRMLTVTQQIKHKIHLKPDPVCCEVSGKIPVVFIVLSDPENISIRA